MNSPTAMTATDLPLSLMNLEERENGKSLSCEDLLWLMHTRYPDLLLIDLQNPERTLLPSPHPSPTNTSPLTNIPSQQKRILGAYALKKLAHDILHSPNKGSAIYSIICNTALRQLISVLGCPFLVVYDEDGAEGNTASRFVHMLDEVVKVTGKAKFNGLRWIRFVRGGMHQFRELYGEDLCTDYAEPRKLETKPEATTASPQPPPPSADDEGDDMKPSENKPVQFQKQLQLNRIQDDPPCAILPDFLFLGGIHSTQREHIIRQQIDHVISVGEVPRFVSDFVGKPDVVSVETFELNLPSPIRKDRFPTSTVSRVRIRPAEPNGGSGAGSTGLLGKEHAVSHYSFPLEDASHAPIDAIFTQTNFIIQQARLSRERVLVHCFGGVSRSATVIIAYLISMQGMSLAEAFSLSFRARPWIRPNEGFWKRLQSYEIEERVVSPVRFRVREDTQTRLLQGGRVSPRAKMLVTSSSEPSPSSLASPSGVFLPARSSGSQRPGVLVSGSSPLSSAYVTPAHSPIHTQFPALPGLALSASKSTGAAMESAFTGSEKPAVRRRHIRSRTMVAFEDEANAALEGTLTAKVMQNMRIDKAETFLKVREICWEKGLLMGGT